MAENRSLPPQDDFARALLRSAQLDEPSNAAYAKVAAALGVSTAVGVASLPAPAVLAASSSGLARWSGSLGAKLTMLGVSGALLVAGAGALLRHELAGNAARSQAAPGSAAIAKAHAALEPPRPSPRGVTSGASALAPNAIAPRALSAADSPAPGSAALANTPSFDADAEVAALANARPAHAAGRAAFASSGAAHALGSSGAAAPPGTSSSAGSSLSEQVQSLDRARVALASGDARAALVEIVHYRRAWPDGVFLTEASVLEIEALAKRGERTLAAIRAQAFVNAHPDSPQAQRLRALIAAPPSE